MRLLRRHRITSSISKQDISNYDAKRVQGKTDKICHAPFKSMRFSLSGNVLACCYNRGYNLGKYPHNTLHDIWFGKKLLNLQNQISNYNFSFGCQSCEKEINSQNYLATGAINYDYLSENNSKYPSMLDFEISNICNLECIMCTGENSSQIRRNREKGAAYPNVYNDKFIEQLEEFIPHLEEARFVGGEPFLINIYYKIWDKIIELKPEIRISVLTNGSVLNETIKELIKKGNFHISISIDSLVKENYEKIRLNADFEEVYKNILYYYNFSREHDKWFNFNLCPMQQNWQDIPDYIRFCNEKQIPVFFHTIKFPPSCALWNFNSDELEKVESFLKKQEFITESDVSKQNIEIYQNLINQVENWRIKALDNSKTSFDDLTLKELGEKFIQHLGSALNNEMNTQTSKTNKNLKYYTELTTRIISDIETNELKRCYINLLRTPAETIIFEMEIKDIEALIEKFKTAGRS